MAVVPMQKVQVLVHHDDVDGFLATAQKFGAIEFTEVADPALTERTVVAPHAELLPRVQHAAQFLSLYAVKPGLWRTLRDGTTTLCTEAEVTKRSLQTDAVEAVVVDVEALQVSLAEQTARVTQLEQQHALLTLWKAVSHTLASLDTRLTTSLLVSAATDATTDVVSLITTALTDKNVAFGVELFEQSALVTVLAAEEEAVRELLSQCPVVVHERPVGREAASVELAAVEEQLAGARGELGLLHDQAEHVAHTHLRDLQITEEILTWEQDRYATQETSRHTRSIAVFTGWIMADRRSAIEADMATKHIAATITDVPLADGEEPPVEIANNALIKPFEVVTRLYGMPGYKDLDPTLFLAGFFFLFFGLSLTDVGYGIFLMATAAIVLTLFKVAPVIRTFMKLLFFMGLGSALVGLLFGGYLGIPAEALPDGLKAIQVFDPIGNPLPVFYLALGLGVFQVMVGMILKIYSDARNGELLQGLLDQGPWLFVFTLGILYVGVITEYVTFVTTDTLVKLIYLGIALIALASGRKGTTLFGKFTSALLALYDSIGYFSDILSYSRLLALGLATTALAFAVNLIAEIVSGTPVIGPVLAIVVLIIGHLFTLAVNTLGAFIHSARLQFVEFFGKFISGTGRTFSPLTRSARYITAREE